MQNSKNSFSFQKEPYLRLLTRFLFTLFIFLGIFSGMGYIFYYLSPFLFAFLFSCLTNPSITRLERNSTRKRPFLVLWFLLFLTLSILSFFCLILPFLWQELVSILKESERYFSIIFVALERLETNIKDFFPFITTSYVDQVESFFFLGLSKLVQHSGSFLSNFPFLLIQFFIFLLATFFISSDFPKFIAFWEEKSSSDLRYLLHVIKNSALSAFGHYLKAQLLLSCGVFLILFPGFLMINQSTSFFIAFIISFLDFIPMIGAGIVLVPWILICVFSNNSQKAVVLFILWTLTGLFRRIFEPKVTADQTGLSPLLSLFSMYLGMQLWGVLGLIFAPVLLLVLLQFLHIKLFQGLFQDLQRVAEDFHRLFQLQTLEHRSDMEKNHED